jgi:hypothetical protein
MKKYWKLARPDGWDFKTGKTINYRNNIGKIVVCPDEGKPKLCSSTVIHASKDVNDCFIGTSIPCSVYRVEGKPVVESTEKCGFKELKVLEELAPEDVFEWDYRTAVAPFDPFSKNRKRVTKKEIQLLRKWVKVWYSVGDSVVYSVGDSVRDYVGDSVLDSVSDYIVYSVGDSVGDYVGYSVWDYVLAYTGWIFRDVVKKWRYIDHIKGEYPFQPAVDLWHRGLVARREGKVWRLHGGNDGRILWEGDVT